MPTRVVIAEDESIIRLDLRETLEEEGYLVVGEAARGDEVLDRVQETQPDLVLLDIKMPGRDGIDVAREITEQRLAAVLILTAFGQRELVEQAAAAGAMAYLVKPFQRSELVAALEVALARHRQLVALDAEVTTLEERLEARKVVERAKGLLMDRGMSESEAYRYIQTSAMRERTTMRAVAEQLLAGTRVP